MSTLTSAGSLQELLASVLAQQGRAAPDRIHRRRSEHSTSAPVDEVAVELRDGTRVELMAKKLGSAALLGAARQAKPAYASSASREAAVYSHIGGEPGPPRCWGVVDEDDGPLLVLERVPGLALRYVGELHLWQAAAAWIAGFHARWPASGAAHLPASLADHLLRYDSAHHRRVLDRAAGFAAAAGRPLPAVVLEQHPNAVRILEELPPCLIHGELYASNVVVDADTPSPRVAALDWEMAGTGPPLLDLAALVSGEWEPDERRAMVEAYRLASTLDVGTVPFDQALLAAELLVSAQWLGWADQWCPPDELAGDWGANAVTKARELEAASSQVQRTGTLTAPPGRSGPRVPEVSPPTGRCLIVNADDLGLSEAVNRGIFEAHDLGIVTSASLMVRGPASLDAAAGVAQRPDLALGLHVDLGEWTWGPDGWVLAYQFADHDDAAAVAAEVARQLALFRALVDRDPTHLDSHQHVHRHPTVAAVLGRAAAALEVPLRGTGDVTYCGSFYGQLSRGEPYPAAITVDNLVQIVDGLEPGVTELGCHPGADETSGCYGPERLQELQVLCDPRVRRAIVAAGVRLLSFAEVT